MSFYPPILGKAEIDYSKKLLAKNAGMAKTDLDALIVRLCRHFIGNDDKKKKISLGGFWGSVKPDIEIPLSALRQHVEESEEVNPQVRLTYYYCQAKYFWQKGEIDNADKYFNDLLCSFGDYIKQQRKSGGVVYTHPFFGVLLKQVASYYKQRYQQALDFKQNIVFEMQYLKTLLLWGEVEQKNPKKVNKEIVKAFKVFLSKDYSEVDYAVHLYVLHLLVDWANSIMLEKTYPIYLGYQDKLNDSYSVTTRGTPEDHASWYERLMFSQKLYKSTLLLNEGKHFYLINPFSKEESGRILSSMIKESDQHISVSLALVVWFTKESQMASSELCSRYKALVLNMDKAQRIKIQPKRTELDLEIICQLADTEDKEYQAIARHIAGDLLEALVQDNQEDRFENIAKHIAKTKQHRELYRWLRLLCEKIQENIVDELSQKIKENIFDKYDEYMAQPDDLDKSPLSNAKKTIAFFYNKLSRISHEDYPLTPSAKVLLENTKRLTFFLTNAIERVQFQSRESEGYVSQRMRCQI